MRGRLRLSATAAITIAALLSMAGAAEPETAAAAETAITGGPSGTIADNSAQLSFTSDSADRFECRIDEPGWSACTSPRSYSGLPDGARKFQVRAIDAGGSADATPAEQNWIVDTTAPEVSLSGSLKAAADASQPLTEPTYDLPTSASEGPVGSGVARIEVLLDGGQIDVLEQECDQGGCPGYLNTIVRRDSMGPGPHELNVVVRDQLGHEAQRSLSLEVPEDPRDFAVPDTMPCTASDAPPNFQAFSLGAVFETLPATEVVRTCDPPYPGEPARINNVTYIYGRIPVECAEGPHANLLPCTPPLAIQTWPACERSLADYELEPGVPYPRTQIGAQRGVPTYEFDEGTRVELYSGMSTIVLFGDDTGQLLRAISAIRGEPLDQPPGLPTLLGTTPPAGDLQPPVDGAVTGELPCAG